MRIHGNEIGIGRIELRMRALKFSFDLRLRSKLSAYGPPYILERRIPRPGQDDIGQNTKMGSNGLTALERLTHPGAQIRKCGY